MQVDRKKRCCLTYVTTDGVRCDNCNSLLSEHQDQRYCPLDSNKVFGLILAAQSKAIRSGIKPSEVFLGPQETSILEDYFGWQNSENAILMGLTIRLMKNNGVRVGNSVRVTAADLEKPKKD